MRNANDVVIRLSDEAAGLRHHLAATNNEIRQIGDGDPRASGLKRELETVRTRILRLYGVLGVHFPDVQPTLANLISPDGISSSEYRRRFLTLKEVFRALADGLQRKPTREDFLAFVNYLGIRELSNTSDVLDDDVLERVASWCR
jgi:hypothetical protein